jgi:hypothetical protein
MTTIFEIKQDLKSSTGSMLLYSQYTVESLGDFTIEFVKDFADCGEFSMVQIINGQLIPLFDFEDEFLSQEEIDDILFNRDCEELDQDMIDTYNHLNNFR